MAKTIAVSDEIYELLTRAKMKDESFSDVIRRLLKRKDLTEVPKVFDEKEWETVAEAFEKQRELDVARRKEML
nr:antitoxin VapB family protein [Candidatus Njordarchaeota archaeon]